MTVPRFCGNRSTRRITCEMTRGGIKMARLLLHGKKLPQLHAQLIHNSFANLGRIV